jgi:PAS domain S-box-containing protein
MFDKELYQAVGETILKEHSIIDAEGNYKYLGGAAKPSSEDLVAALLGTNIREYIHKEDIALVLDQLNKLPAGKTTTLLPFRYRLNNNIYRWIESSVTNMVDDKAVNGYLINLRDITDVTETSLIKSKIASSYSTFFDKHPFGIVHMSMDGIIDIINPKLSEDLGYKLIDISKRPLISFFLPEYRRKVFQMFHKASKQGKAETFDVQVYTVRGHHLQVNLTIVPVVFQDETVEIYAVVKDITDRVTLRESLKKLSIVADKTTNGVLITDKEGTIEWVNNGFTQITGYSLTDAAGFKVVDLLKTNVTPETMENLTKQLNDGVSFSKEMRCIKKDGSKYWVLVDITPVLDENNKLVQRIVIHTDITQRKQAEDELKSFADDLYKRNKELEQFGYIVSHNLRSPVANILGIANLLELDKDDPETVKICTKDLNTSITRLDSVIEDLSKILSMTDGSKILNRENIDVTELLENVITDLKEAIKNSEAHIQIRHEPCRLFSHKAYLYSIFFNLINNSIKYKSDFKPIINISITVEGEWIIMKFSDNGIGIDLIKHANDLFKPYKRFNVTLEGKGLGLFLVKNHVEVLGGTIAIESAPGKGSTFIITLPNKTQDASV